MSHWSHDLKKLPHVHVLTPINEMMPVDLPGGGLETDQKEVFLPGNEIVLTKENSMGAYFSNVRFPRRPRALLGPCVLDIFVGLGRGAITGGSVTGVGTGSSVFLASIDGVDSVGGAEIKALIWMKRCKPLRYLGAL